MWIPYGQIRKAQAESNPNPITCTSTTLTQQLPQRGLAYAIWRALVPVCASRARLPQVYVARVAWRATTCPFLSFPPTFSYANAEPERVAFSAALVKSVWHQCRKGMMPCSVHAMFIAS